MDVTVAYRHSTKGRAMTQQEISAALREARAAGDHARVADLEDRLTLLAYRWKMQQEDADVTVSSSPAPASPQPRRTPKAVALLAAVLGG